MLDRRAQLFAIDLLLAFIPLTIMLGMSANALSGVALQTQNYANIYSLQRRTNDAADVLVKSPGTPPNWNSTIPPTVGGLAYYDPSTGKSIPNRIQALYSAKVMALNESDIISLTGTSNYYLTISLIGTSMDISYVWGSEPPDNAASVAVAERYSNFVWSDMWGVLMDIQGAGPGSPINCAGDIGKGGGQKGCVTDNTTLDDWTTGDFWLYLEYDDQAASAISVNGAVLISQTQFPACKPGGSSFVTACDNTDADTDCNWNVVGPTSTETLYFKSSINMDDGTQVEPPTDGGYTCVGGDHDNVDTITTRVKIPSAWMDEWNTFNISIVSDKGYMNGYVIRAPPGAPWEVVNPYLANTMYYSKLTLKVWTE